MKIVPGFTVFAIIACASAAGAQPVPRPFPRPSDRSSEPAPVDSPSATPDQTKPTAERVLPRESTDAPTEGMLGFPIYPNARFITSYDAGRSQRYYLFGTNASFRDMVSYYSIVLEERGERVFDEPPVHMFEIGRFREETMAFPPGVTIKDYTWDGSEGYANPTPGADPSHYRTVIQFVPAPADSTARYESASESARCFLNSTDFSSMPERKTATSSNPCTAA